MVRTLYLAAFLLTTHVVIAQESMSRCGYGILHEHRTEKTTVADPDEDNYDVKHVSFDIEVGNTSTNIKGVVTTTATTVISNFSVYTFELDGQLTIDSVKIDGNKLPVQTTGAVRKVSLLSPLANNTSFKAEVYYHGQPTSGSGQFFTGGLHKIQRPSGTNILYTISDPDRTDEWWPCKQSLKDKIDSVDMWVTVPDSLKVGTNGLLVNTTALAASRVRYEWKTNYPIDYYLITLAVAPYSEYNYYMHFNDGSNDSMLIQNFVYDSAMVMTPTVKGALDSTGVLVNYLSELYGKYPFYKEKYGHCLVGALGGGMEHQTMTTLGPVNTQLIAHEMGHQWWGNNVTYGSWKDIWLSEGLATYTEQLYLEQFHGKAAALAERKAVFGSVMTKIFGSVYVDDTTSISRIFDSRLTYNKGAAVAHMLRYLAPHDSLFFKGLRDFQQQYAYGNAVTDDLKQVFEQVYSKDLDSFFRQWVYGQGYPRYSIKYYQSGNDVHIQINQSTTFFGSVPAFHMPVELRLKSASGDTVVQLMNTEASQNYVVNWSSTVTGIDIDPDDHIVNWNGAVTQDQSILSVKETAKTIVKIYPNPALGAWHIEGLKHHAMLILSDMQGKKIWSSNNTGIVPAENLPSGTYILQVTDHSSGEKQYFKLTK